MKVVEACDRDSKLLNFQESRKVWFSRRGMRGIGFMALGEQLESVLGWRVCT